MLLDLSEGGADVNGQGAWTPLAVAASRGHKDVVKVLLENGADPNLKGRQCDKPLLACAAALANYYANDENFAEVAQYLINAGADVNSANQGGDVALDYVILYKEARVKVDCFADVLLKNGANISFVRPSANPSIRAFLEKRQKELIDEAKDQTSNTDENEIGDQTLENQKLSFSIFDLQTLASDESTTYCLNDNGVVIGSYMLCGQKTFYVVIKSRNYFSRTS